MALTFPITRQCTKGWSQTLEDNVVRTQFSDGVEMRVPRFTRTRATIDNVIWKYISIEEATTIREFWDSTTGHGSLKFDLTLVGNRISHTFNNVVFASPPKITWIGFNRFELSCSFKEV